MGEEAGDFAAINVGAPVSSKKRTFEQSSASRSFSSSKEAKQLKQEKTEAPQIKITPQLLWNFVHPHVKHDATERPRVCINTIDIFHALKE